MIQEIKDLLYQIKTQFEPTEIVSLMQYGSSVGGKTRPNDIDLYLVVKNRNFDLGELEKIISTSESRVDLSLLYQDEIRDANHFRDIGKGCFSLLYLSKGQCLMGTNIFAELLKDASHNELRRGILESINDYILRLRQKRFYTAESTTEKIQYFRKYIARIILDMYLYEDVSKYDELSTLFGRQLIEKALETGLLSNREILENEHKDYVITEYYKALDELSRKVLELKG